MVEIVQNLSSFISSMTADQKMIILVLIVLWVLPWKGVALWKSANLRQKKWFIALLVLNTFAILDIIYIFFFAKKKERDNKNISNK